MMISDVRIEKKQAMLTGTVLFEFGLIVAGNAFHRWIVHCMSAAGLKDLTVLKSTQSGFAGFPVDRFTTLAETSDRILATDVAARWRFNPEAVGPDFDFNASYDSVKALLLEGFSENFSHALQTTLFEMGTKVLTAHPEIDEMKFSMPNKHHFLVDLSPFGEDNPGEVFFAADRPYGLIEATVTRQNASDPGNVWDGIAGFC